MPQNLDVRAAIEEAIKSYHELNGTTIEEIPEPSALEYMRYVAQNRPFVVRRGCSAWLAQRWNVDYLLDTMGETPIAVAITPHGFENVTSSILFRKSDLIQKR